MKALFTILVTLFVLTTSLSTQAGQEVYTPKNTIVITNDGGGIIGQYIEKYNLIRNTGVNVKIDDLCISACTLVLSLVPEDRICASEHALFGFHHAYMLDRATMRKQIEPTTTKMVLAMYPKKIQEKLIEYGWNTLDPDDMIYIKATELVKLCN